MYPVLPPFSPPARAAQSLSLVCTSLIFITVTGAFLTLWLPLPLSLSVSVFMSGAILRASGWHRHRGEEGASEHDEDSAEREAIGGNKHRSK